MHENKHNQAYKAILKHIEERGYITIADYMEIALNAYYNRPNPFGVEGDFITAPEISQLFGEMIALWFVDLWQQTGMPEDIKLVELGPGRGTLSADILRTIEKSAPQMMEALALHLVENSASLRKVQKEKLKGYNVSWHNSFSDVPKGFCFVVANEFFDALPIRQFEKIAGEWQERVVIQEDGAFKFSSIKSKESLVPDELKAGEDNSIFETSPVSQKIVIDIAGRINEHGGAALIIDYGYRASSIGDTLQAVKMHSFSDVLQEPGEKDITAHVDFAALKKAVKPTGAVFVGPITQGEFLGSLGIELRASNLCQGRDEKQQQGIMTGVERLISNKEMGELFKVCALLPKESII